MEQQVRRLYNKGFTNPSAIVSILFQQGLSGRFYETRKLVKKEIQRLIS